nr:alpha/beta hydrolase [Methylopila capsulata]
MRKAVSLRGGLLIFALLVAGLIPAPGVAAESVDAPPPHHRAVRAIGDKALPVGAGTRLGALRLYASQSLDAPDPAVRRAIVLVHGRLRNADVYFRSAETARAAAGEQAAGALLVAPQFLADPDADLAGGLPPDALRWTPEGWMGGEAATAPAPISSFEALDALVARLADRRLFPNLAEIVVAGHSGGGQVVQRYAATSQEADALAKDRAPGGAVVRFVVANPSSYLYFSPERPMAGGGFAALDLATCPRADRWKYGLADRPPYAAGRSGAEIEAAYLSRDLTMLLGAEDRNPNHPALDKSCAAEAQGPNRMERGLAYARYLAARHGAAFRHVVRVVPGVGHDGDGMFTSPCGVEALFASEPCPAAP